jgi:pyruvate/2-oxoglutarate dehydrogenase complex dihydrolipoamide acyltransferase (E2) component
MSGAPGHLVMPKLGLTMEEGKVAKWQVRAGEAFAAGDILVVVETDKIANDVEAPEAGVLEELLVPEGETVPVSAPIARWRLGGGASPALSAAPSGAPRTPVMAVPKPVAPAEAQCAPSPEGNARILATPYAKRLARDASIDLAQVAGSGPRGRIKAQDVTAVQTRRATAVATRAPDPDVLAPQATQHLPAPRALSLAQIEVATRGLDDIAARFAEAERKTVRLALIGMACARGFPGSSIGVELEGRAVPLPEDGTLRTRVARLGDGGDVEMASGGAVLIVPGGDATLFAPAAPAGWPAALGIGAPREVLARASSGDIVAAHLMTLALSYDSAAIGNGHAAAFLSALKSQLEDPLVLLAG